MGREKNEIEGRDPSILNGRSYCDIKLVERRDRVEDERAGSEEVKKRNDAVSIHLAGEAGRSSHGLEPRSWKGNWVGPSEEGRHSHGLGPRIWGGNWAGQVKKAMVHTIDHNYYFKTVKTSGSVTVSV